MKKETVKKYKIQGAEFQFEKPCLKLTQKFESIYDRYVSFEKEDPEFISVKKEFNLLKSKVLATLSKDEILKVQLDGTKLFDFLKDEKVKAEMINTIDEYTRRSLEVKRRFLNRNMQEIIETCLCGDLEKINYDVSGNEYYELRDVASEVFNDFFLSMNN